MIYLAKIFSVIMGFMVISRIYVDYKSKLESRTMFVFWFIIWIVIVVVALTYPHSIDLVMAYLGNKRGGIGTVLGIAIVFLFYVSYRRPF